MKLTLDLKSVTREFTIDQYNYDDYGMTLLSDGEVVAVVPHTWIDCFVVSDLQEDLE